MSLTTLISYTGIHHQVAAAGPQSTLIRDWNKIVQETRAQIWPNLAPEYICRFMIDSLSPDSSLFKSAGCQTVNFGHLMLFAFEK